MQFIEDQPDPQFRPPAYTNQLAKSVFRRLASTAGAAGMAVLTLGHSTFRAPFQVEYQELDLPLRSLSPSFDGFRLVQLSDLHTGGGAPVPYLRAVIDRINDLAPDLVCVTGDLVSSSLEFVAAAGDLLKSLRPRVLVTFGNHDYSTTAWPWVSTDVADALQRRLEGDGIAVLRNRAVAIERDGSRFWVVGLEDFWSNRFDPDAAFAPVVPGEPAVALSHNPDTFYATARRGAQWTLAGHTHGGQIRLPLLGPLVLPVIDKRLAAGLFALGDNRLYVTRGVGFKIRSRFRCPPEVPVFTLRAAASSCS